MERTQKQITGRAPVPYSWDSGQYSRARYQSRSRDAFRVENVSAARENTRKTKHADRIRLAILEIATIAILVLMLSMVIGKLKHITDIRLQQETLGKANEQLLAEITTAQTHLGNLSKDSSIEFLARTKLNMIEPDEDGVHVLNTVTRATSDATHTAEAGNKP